MWSRGRRPLPRSQPIWVLRTWMPDGHLQLGDLDIPSNSDTSISENGISIYPSAPGLRRVTPDSSGLLTHTQLQRKHFFLCVQNTLTPHVWDFAHRAVLQFSVDANRTWHTPHRVKAQPHRIPPTNFRCQSQRVGPQVTQTSDLATSLGFLGPPPQVQLFVRIEWLTELKAR